MRGVRRALGISPTYKSVDTCAGEFPARTPYYYSTYELEDEVERGENPSVIVLGSGPNRIGQGIDRKSTRLNSSHANISYAVFCLKKKKTAYSGQRQMPR